jgi:hypothetical protein
VGLFDKKLSSKAIQQIKLEQDGALAPVLHELEAFRGDMKSLKAGLTALAGLVKVQTEATNATQKMLVEVNAHLQVLKAGHAGMANVVGESLTALKAVGEQTMAQVVHQAEVEAASGSAIAGALRKLGEQVHEPVKALDGVKVVLGAVKAELASVKGAQESGRESLAGYVTDSVVGMTASIEALRGNYEELAGALAGAVAGAVAPVAAGMSADIKALRGDHDALVGAVAEGLGSLEAQFKAAMGGLEAQFKASLGGLETKVLGELGAVGQGVTLLSPVPEEHQHYDVQVHESDDRVVDVRLHGDPHNPWGVSDSRPPFRIVQRYLTVEEARGLLAKAGV